MRISDWSSDVCSSDLYLSSEPDPALFPASLARRVVLPHLQQVAARPHNGHPSIDIGFRGACPQVSVRSSTGGSHPGYEADWEEVLRGHTMTLHVSIGRAWCREGVCQFVSISVVAVTLKKT